MTVVLPKGFTSLRALSLMSSVFLCREDATGKLLVIKTREKKDVESFRRESKNLYAIQSFDLAPKLFFAMESESHFLIGMEYFAGSPLVHLKLSSQNIAALSDQIKKGIFQLHQEFNMTHGDISPKNILVSEEKDISNPFRIHFSVRLIDWEFAEKISQEKVDTFHRYRGTPGFSEGSSNNQRTESDLLALKTCIEHLSPVMTNERHQSHKARSKKKWFTKITTASFLK